jgi:hypothetical protein
MTLRSTLIRYQAPPMLAPFGKTLGPDGRLWFVDISYNPHTYVGAIRPASG